MKLNHFTQSLYKTAAWAAFSAVFVCSFGCSGKSRNNRGDDDVGPAGQKIPQVDTTYYDAKPDISADGTKVVFISGYKDEIKAYRYLIGDKRKVVTDKNVGDQLEVAIAPNGNFVTIVGADSDGFSIYVTPYAGGTLTEVKDNDEGKGEVSAIAYSPDSAYLAYIRRNADDGLRKLYVVPMGGGGTPGNGQMLSVVGEDESNPTWIPQGGGQYQLVTKYREEDSFSDAVKSRTFTAGLSGLADTNLAEDLGLSRSIPFAADSNGIYLSLLNSQLETRRQPISAAGEEMKDTFNVFNVAAFLSKSGGSPEEVDDTLGAEVLSISANTAGTAGTWVTREIYACKNSKGKVVFHYGATLVLQDPATGSFTRILPRPKTSEFGADFSLVDDVCDVYLDEAEEEKVSLDSNMVFAKMSADSTLTDYNITYVSFFSGDLEVYLLKKTSSLVTFYRVSDNPIPAEEK